MKKSFLLASSVLFIFLLFSVFKTEAQNTPGKTTLPNNDKTVNPTKPITPIGNDFQNSPPEKSPCEGAIMTIVFDVSNASKTVNPTKPRTANDGLTPIQITMLQKAAAIIKTKPECRILVSGYGSDSKQAQQLSWDRVNAVIRYLVEKAGISDKRFIFSYGNPGPAGNVDISFSSTDGPTTVPPPFPGLRN